MGMFDDVKCLYPLPDGAPIDGYQTKDTDAQYLEKYVIAEDGRLLHSVVHYEDRSDKTAPPGSFRGVAGIMTPVHDRWEEIPFHGALNFGHYAVDTKVSWDFTALYDRGKLPKMEGGRSAASEAPVDLA